MSSPTSASCYLVCAEELVSTFTDAAGRAPPLQRRAVLNGGNQLLVWQEALLLRRGLSVQGAGSPSSPSRGVGGVMLGPASRLGQAPPRSAAAAVWEGEGADAAVQGVRGSTGA